MEQPLKILVLNLGSTSFKFKLFSVTEGETLLAHGGIERIGDRVSPWSTRYPVEEQGEAPIANYDEALGFCFGLLSRQGVLPDPGELDAVAYKAVHGGSISGAQMATPELLTQMERYSSFAPAHNPMYIGAMRAVSAKFPGLRQVACFETAFHASVPLHRAVYGVPYEWVEKYGVRRWGFHGSSHSYIAMKMAELEPDCRRVISIHLGGSSSLCAIHDGKSVATSMGATPQSGLFQNNRVGDFDAFCVPALSEQLDSSDAVFEELSKKGGFLGLSGVSNDLRDILEARKAGNERADLAFRAFCDNIVGYIGMFAAYMRGVDAICFTGGIGLNSAEVRGQVCGDLGFALKPGATRGKISDEGSPVKVYALETNEELMVARRAAECLRREESATR